MIGDVLALFFGGTAIALGDLTPDVVLSEDAHDAVTITDHPVEIGAAITDHAFSNPSALLLRIGFTKSKGFLTQLLGTDSPTPEQAYEQLLTMMREREPIDVVTSLRAYTDMLIAGVEVTRDDKTQNILLATVRLRQILLVSTATTALKPEAQKEPEKTLGVAAQGTKAPKAVKESALSTIGGIFK